MERKPDTMSETTKVTRRGFVAVLTATGLSACAPRTKRLNPEFLPINFSGAPIPLDVTAINAVVRPRVTSDVSPADADFVVPPEAIARLWPKQRLRAAGGQNTVRYIIDDASAVSRTTETGEVVVATIQVRLVMITPYGIEEAGAGARVESEVRFDGFPNMIERQEALHRVSQDIAAKLDDQLTRSVQRQLGAYIRSGS